MVSETDIVRDKAWKTAKSRMRAERRYRRYDTASHALICYYSLLLIVASLFSNELTRLVPQADKVIIALSMAVFALSIVLYGYRFSQAADRHRECYLALQRLYDNPPEDISTKYHEILDRFPNHSPFDYLGFLVEHKLNGLRINDIVTGKESVVSCRQIFIHYIRTISLAIVFLMALMVPWALIVVLYSLPIQ